MPVPIGVGAATTERIEEDLNNSQPISPDTGTKADDPGPAPTKHNGAKAQLVAYRLALGPRLRPFILPVSAQIPALRAAFILPVGAPPPVFTHGATRKVATFFITNRPHGWWGGVWVGRRWRHETRTKPQATADRNTGICRPGQIPKKAMVAQDPASLYGRARRIFSPTRQTQAARQLGEGEG